MKIFICYLNVDGKSKTRYEQYCVKMQEYFEKQLQGKYLVIVVPVKETSTKCEILS